MTATAEEAPRAGAPWHFWVVAILAALWNSIGGYDYTMSHLQGEAYGRSAGMSEAQLAFMAAYPVWMHAVWAVGVWGSVAGSILLLLRMRWAFHAFALSTLGAVGSALYIAATPGGAKTMGLVFPCIIIVICLVLVWYARMMTKRDVLR